MFINQPSQDRYTRSNKLLLPHIPRLQKELRGDIVLVDMEDGEVSRLLDQKAGVDGYLVRKHHIKSIALRVKTCKKRPFRDFSIRSHTYHSNNTELLKIPQAIKQGATYPTITIKINLDMDGSWLEGAAIQTSHLYQFVDDNREVVMGREVDNGDGSRFVWVGWEELKKDCLGIKIF